MKRNGQLLLRPRTDKCLVLATGPSLEELDLSTITEDTIAMNSFHEYDKGRTKVTYYMLMDTIIFTEDNGRTLKKVVDLYKDSIIVLNGKYVREVEALIGHHDNVYYTLGYGRFIKEKSKLDFTKNIPVSMNVTADAIKLAIFLRYNEIDIYGFDFTLITQFQFRHAGENGYYNIEFDQSMNLFWHTLIAKEHEEISKMAKSRNIRIVNKSKNSLSAAYEKEE